MLKTALASKLTRGLVAKYLWQARNIRQVADITAWGNPGTLARMYNLANEAQFLADLIKQTGDLDYLVSLLRLGRALTMSSMLTEALYEDAIMRVQAIQKILASAE